MIFLGLIIIGITMGIQSQNYTPDKPECFQKPKCNTHIHKPYNMGDGDMSED